MGVWGNPADLGIVDFGPSEPPDLTSPNPDAKDEDFLWPGRKAFSDGGGRDSFVVEDGGIDLGGELLRRASRGTDEFGGGETSARNVGVKGGGEWLKSALRIVAGATP
jgi:hypothetical protein